MIWRIVIRDLRRNIGGAAMPVAFFLLVAMLYPFAVGPDGALLARTGGGVMWVAALLAALLPIDRLVAPDAADGTLDQYAMRGVADESVALAKMLAHWLAFAPALILAALPASALLHLDGAALARIELGLLLGTPGLAALGVTIAALTARLSGASALAGLLLLPLAIPLLIFGAGGGYKLLAASSLLLVALCPFAGGAALRALRD